MPLSQRDYLLRAYGDDAGIYLDILSGYPMVSRIPSLGEELTMEGVDVYTEGTLQNSQTRRLNKEYNETEDVPVEEVTLKPVILGDMFKVDKRIRKNQKKAFNYIANRYSRISRNNMVKANDMIINGDKVGQSGLEFDGLFKIAATNGMTYKETTTIATETGAKNFKNMMLAKMRLLTNTSIIVTDDNGLAELDKAQDSYANTIQISSNFGDPYQTIGGREIVHAGYKYDGSNVIGTWNDGSDDYVVFFLLNFADDGLRFGFDPQNDDEEGEVPIGIGKEYNVDTLALLVPRTKFSVFQFSLKKS